MSEIVTFTDDQVKLLKRTICRPKEREATSDELALFVGQCKRTGLDPFSKQIYAIFRWSKKENAELMTIQTAIDGFRLIAERTRCYLGKAATYWCGEDGEWQDVWLSEKHPEAAKVIVRKVLDGQVAESPAVAHWREYADESSPMWKSMPANQLAKCAEALALRQAFPNDLSGLYTIDEMAQALRQEQVALTAGDGDGSARGVVLTPEVERVIARAQVLGHEGLSSRATAEMALGNRSPEAIKEWVATAEAELDEMAGQGAEPPEAEVVTPTAEQLEERAGEKRAAAIRAAEGGDETLASELDAEADALMDAVKAMREGGDGE